MTARSDVRRALVASDSILARDPRVLRQVRWLRNGGWQIDTLGRGPAPDDVDGMHFAMRRRSVIVRALAYLFLPNRSKYRVLQASTIPTGLLRKPYQLVVLNEIELLPWFVDVRDRLLAPGGRAHLDLHEYAPSQRIGAAYRLVFKRYRDWLVGFVASPLFASRSTVSKGIARLYEQNFGIPAPAIVRSTADFVDQAPSSVSGEQIRLVHHGAASLSRGLPLMIDAMALVDDRYGLDLMLVGSPESVGTLRRLAQPLGDRVAFRDPVPVADVARTLNEYDAELIFFPPATENLRYVLPNKLFEAVQGRLALVIGPSIEMVEFVEQYGNGVIADGWSAADLAEAIRRLDVRSLSEYKAASDRAAADVSAAREGERFLAVVGG